MAVLGSTQAATEKAPEGLSDGEFGTESWPLTPSKRTALPETPGAQELPAPRVAVLPLPDASTATLPEPSSNVQAATERVMASEGAVICMTDLAGRVGPAI